MAWSDRFAITPIKDEPIDNFSMSIDEMDEIVAVALYTPDMENTNEHYHIEFSRDQARVLWDWLSDFLEEDTETKYQNDLEAERDDWDMEELDD